MAARRRMLSWQVKLPLLLVIFTTAPLALMAFWRFGLLEETYEASTIDSLKALARAKAEAIDQFTVDRRSEVTRIAELVSPTMSQAQAAAAAVEQREPEESPQPLPELRDAEALQTPAPAPAQAPEEEPPLGTDGEPLDGQGAQEAQEAQEPPPEPPRPAHGPAADLQEALKELRRQLGLILWDQQKFEELLVIDANGQVLVSTFSEHEGKSAAELAYFRNGLGATYVQPVFMSPITERLTMVISTPIRDGEDGQVMGVLAARLNLSRFFRLINETAGLGETGETVVAKLIDSSILFMAPTRHDPNAALARQVPLGAAEGQPLQNAARGESGTGRSVDYRGQCIYAAWEHLDSLDWALATKIDCAEAMEPVEDARTRLMWLATVMIALALLSSFFAARALVRPLRELEEAADRISKGDFDVKLRIRGGDEIGELADSFERMVAAIRFFRENARTEEEQAAMLEAEARAEAEAQAGAEDEDEPSR